MDPASQYELWNSVSRELECWAAEGLIAQFWIRDDDACDLTPQLIRLAEFARCHGVHIGLAVVPAKLTKALIDFLRDPKTPFLPMCHGWAHTNHGTAAKPGEFGPDRPYAKLQADAACALDTYAASLERTPPFFVPPFGRITDKLSIAMNKLGFASLSNGHTRFEARLVRAHGMTGLLPVNPIGPSRQPRLDVHIDPIDWRARTALPRADIELRLLGELRARRKRYLPPERPIGILMHHLVHDEAIWDVCKELVTLLQKEPATAFPDLERLMASVASPAVTAPRPSPFQAMS